MNYHLTAIAEREDFHKPPPQEFWITKPQSTLQYPAWSPQGDCNAKPQIGTQGLQVSAIGLGCMGLSMSYGAALEEAAALNVIERAVELGITFFDTAEMYGPFDNEILVGKALAPVRERVVIATKFGFKIMSGQRRPFGVDSRPEHIREVCDASLKRLGVETIDLFYQHRVNPAVPIEEVAGAVGDLVKAGKVRFFRPLRGGT